MAEESLIFFKKFNTARHRNLFFVYFLFCAAQVLSANTAVRVLYGLAATLQSRGILIFLIYFILFFAAGAIG